MIRELDHQKTPLGELVLRCRESVNVPEGLVYEVKLGEEMLMSSSVTHGERALSRLAMERRGARPTDVLVGGLGLGYTVLAALAFAAVRKVDVVELLEPVIEWHRKGLVPAAKALMEDARCTLIHGDFFEYVAAAPAEEARGYDAILIDIDHSPDCWLQSSHGTFYTRPRLEALLRHLTGGGVFALWSADEPSEELVVLIRTVFGNASVNEVSFRNPHMNEMDRNWILIAERAAAG